MTGAERSTAPLQQLISWKTAEQRERAVQHLQQQAAEEQTPNVTPLIVEAYPAATTGSNEYGWRIQSTTYPGIVVTRDTLEQCQDVYAEAVVHYLSAH